MATVTYVRERGGWAGEEGDDASSYERSWYVYRKTDGVMVSLDFDDVYGIIVPAYASHGATVSEMPGVECNLIGIRHQDDGSEVWIATASYRSPTVGSEPIPNDFDTFMSRSQNNSPNEPFRPRFSGGGMVVTEAVWEDLDGEAIVNSAGDPFENQLTRDVTVQVDRVTVNERDKANTAAIGKCEGRRLLANATYEDLDHVDKSDGVTTRYYRNTYEVWTHPYQNWTPTIVMDRGYRELRIVFDENNNPEFKLLPIRDKWGEPVNKPVPLDEAGQALAPKAKPRMLRFRLREEGPLNVPFLG